MNIEPAALLIWKSTPKWIDITVDLLEFLLALADKWGVCVCVCVFCVCVSRCVSNDRGGGLGPGFRV